MLLYGIGPLGVLAAFLRISLFHSIQKITENYRKLQKIGNG
jgi:hypothetical protein